MTQFTISTTLDVPHADAERRVRTALARARFGIITEIDLQATFREKLGADTPPRTILGACRPQLAHRAVAADPRIAAMLPCNVVVSADGDGRSRVEGFDPEAMTSFSDAPDVAAIAAEARDRLLDAFSLLLTEDLEDHR